MAILENGGPRLVRTWHQIVGIPEGDIENSANNRDADNVFNISRVLPPQLLVSASRGATSIIPKAVLFGISDFHDPGQVQVSVVLELFAEVRDRYPRLRVGSDLHENIRVLLRGLGHTEEALGDLVLEFCMLTPADSASLPHPPGGVQVFSDAPLPDDEQGLIRGHIFVRRAQDTSDLLFKAGPSPGNLTLTVKPFRATPVSMACSIAGTCGMAPANDMVLLFCSP